MTDPYKACDATNSSKSVQDKNLLPFIWFGTRKVPNNNKPVFSINPHPKQ